VQQDARTGECRVLDCCGPTAESACDRRLPLPLAGAARSQVAPAKRSVCSLWHALHMALCMFMDRVALSVRGPWLAAQQVATCYSWATCLEGAVVMAASVEIGWVGSFL
jgi:hypothetical protein